MAELDPDQMTASQLIKAQLAEWGLDSLAGTVSDLIRQGLSGDAITLQLRSTSEYQQRFAANAARVKKGLAALSPAEYIATENAYRQVMQTYGLPATFYDQQDDFHRFLENDLSPDELNTRAKAAQETLLNADPTTRAIFRDFYGLTDGAAIAAIIDPARALPIVQNMAATTQAGAVARNAGLDANRDRLSLLVDQGVTADQFRQGFSEIGQTRATESALANRFGQSFDQADAEAAKFSGLPSALRRQQELYGAEQALFDGKPAADKTSLSRRTSGSY